MAGVEAMRARGCIVASGVRQDWCGELLDTEEVVITRLCRVVWAGLRSMLDFEQTVFMLPPCHGLALVFHFSCIFHLNVFLVILFLPWSNLRSLRCLNHLFLLYSEYRLPLPHYCHNVQYRFSSSLSHFTVRPIHHCHPQQLIMLLQDILRIKRQLDSGFLLT